jgi:small GTP-binding protein
MNFFKSILSWIKGLFWKKEMEIAIVGLQNSGKSTFVQAIGMDNYDEEKMEDTIPTIGFNNRQLKKGKVNLNLWDLGGQPRYRESWEKFCRTADVIIYVVDAADVGNLDITKVQLHQLLSWPSLKEIPLLLLGNKNDLKGALTEEQLIDNLDLKQIKARKVACYSISAKYCKNIEICLKWLTNLPKKKKKKSK